MMLKFLIKLTFTFLFLILSIIAFSQEKEEDHKAIWVRIESNHDLEIVDTIDHTKVMRNHMDYLSKIHTESKMLALLTFQGGGGLMFFKNHPDSVKKILSLDPAIQQDFFKLTYYDWKSIKGNICFAEKANKLVNVNMTFLEENQEHKIDDAKMQEVMKALEEKIAELKMNDQTICLGNIEGGYVIVAKDESMSEQVEKFCVQSQGLYKSESLKAWAKEGAFCQ